MSAPRSGRGAGLPPCRILGSACAALCRRGRRPGRGVLLRDACASTTGSSTSVSGAHSSRGCKSHPGTRVLDVGCGIGRWSRLLAARGAVVTGVDLSPTMIAEARAQGGRPAGSRANAASSCRTRRRWRSKRTFDLIVCVTVLQHILDVGAMRSALQRMAQHLAPGGRLVCSRRRPLASRLAATQRVHGAPPRRLPQALPCVRTSAPSYLRRRSGAVQDVAPAPFAAPARARSRSPRSRWSRPSRHPSTLSAGRRFDRALLARRVRPAARLWRLTVRLSGRSDASRSPCSSALPPSSSPAARMRPGARQRIVLQHHHRERHERRRSRRRHVARGAVPGGDRARTGAHHRCEVPKISLLTALPPIVNSHGVRIVARQGGSEIDAGAAWAAAVRSSTWRRPMSRSTASPSRNCANAGILVRAVAVQSAERDRSRHATSGSTSPRMRTICCSKATTSSMTASACGSRARAPIQRSPPTSFPARRTRACGRCAASRTGAQRPSTCTTIASTTTTPASSPATSAS